MVEVKLVSVFLWLQLAGHPFTGVDSHLRTADSFPVFKPADVVTVRCLLCHPVVATVVGNVDHFVKKGFGLFLARERVLGGEIWVFDQPLQNR